MNAAINALTPEQAFYLCTFALSAGIAVSKALRAVFRY